MKKKELETSLVVPATVEFIERRIRIIRGQRVILDSDLADLYQVPTKNLNLAIKRNGERFPYDFMFQLNENEFKDLRFQFETSSWGGRRSAPHAFTELGVAMLSSVLHSDRAIKMNIYIMRAFVALRESLVSTKKIAEKIEYLEAVQRDHSENLSDLNIAVTKLVTDTKRKPDAIGFEV